MQQDNEAQTGEYEGSWDESAAAEVHWDEKPGECKRMLGRERGTVWNRRALGLLPDIPDTTESSQTPLTFHTDHFDWRNS